MEIVGMLGLMGGLVCVVAGLMLAVVALLAWLLWAWIRQTRDTPRQLTPRPAEFLRAARAQLLPWHPAALGDLAARWEGEWTSALPTVTMGEFRGVVKSLARPQARGWLAFHLSRTTRREVHMVLCSSARCLTLHTVFHSLWQAAGHVTIQVDGRAWGRAVLPAGVYRRGHIVLQDASGREVGFLRHQARRLVRAGWVGRMTIYYGPVHVRGRPSAEVACTWVKVPNAAQRARSSGYGRPFTPYPALRNMAQPLSEDEEIWLLVAVAVEIMLDILMHDNKRIQDGWTPLPGLQVTFARAEV